MSLELKVTFNLDRPDRKEESFGTYPLPPDVTEEQISDIVIRTHYFISEIISESFDFKGGKHGG